MEKIISLLGVAGIMAVYAFIYYRRYQNAHEKVDGVESIDGIRYLVKDVDVGPLSRKSTS